uniref:C-type lectin domain-containing protein n=1 Tax=Neolamprologus brichardi TaxID=32507 RepID=A0A3Q4G7V9_NEOBR
DLFSFSVGLSTSVALLSLSNRCFFIFRVLIETQQPTFAFHYDAVLVPFTHKSEICKYVHDVSADLNICTDTTAGFHFLLLLLSYVISNETQNNDVSEKGKNKTFWIGLQHDHWTWADGSCSTYRNWAETKNNDECASFDLNNLNKVGCVNEDGIFCTKGK